MIDRGASAVTMLSLEQEEALARDAALLSYFYLLLNGWADAQILREYEFDEAQIERLRHRLIALELIELLPRRRIRLRVGRRLVWRPDGPVRRTHERQVQTEFLRGAFLGRASFSAGNPPSSPKVPSVSSSASSNTCTTNSCRWPNSTRSPLSPGTAPRC